MTSVVTKRPDLHLAARRTRKVVVFLHLCTGLVLGLYFSLLGLTGSALIFKSELHRVFKPSLYYVVPPENSSRLSLDKLAQVFKDNHPDISIASLGLPVVAKDVLIVGYRAAGSGQKKGQSMQALINPYTGNVIAEQLSGGWFFRTLHNLHAKLLLDDLGEDINRYGVLAIFALLLSGFWLWWPSFAGVGEAFNLSKVLSQFKQKLSVKFNGSFNRKTFDIHNVVGFFTAGILLVFAVTACSELWHEQVAVIVAGLTGGPVEPDRKGVGTERKGPQAKGLQTNELQTNESPPSYDAMLSTAKSALPNMVAVAITDKLGVRMVSPEDSSVVPYVVPRCVTVFFNKSDANLLRVEDPAKLPLGQQIMAWLLPIHFGQWGPGFSYYFVKAIWFVVGLCPSILFGSGVMMFMLKRGNKRNSGLD
jgi:uncharacterized iron-regulated membrane protein